MDAQEIYKKIDSISSKTDSLIVLMGAIDKRMGILETQVHYHIEGTVQNRDEIKILRELSQKLQSELILLEASRRSDLDIKASQAVARSSERKYIGWFVGIVATVVAIVTNLSNILAFFR